MKGKVKEIESSTAEESMDLDHGIFVLVAILLPDARAAGPLIQSDVLVFVQVTDLKKAGGTSAPSG